MSACDRRTSRRQGGWGIVQCVVYTGFTAAVLAVATPLVSRVIAAAARSERTLEADVRWRAVLDRVRADAADAARIDASEPAAVIFRSAPGSDSPPVRWEVAGDELIRIAGDARDAWPAPAGLRIDADGTALAVIRWTTPVGPVAASVFSRSALEGSP